METGQIVDEVVKLNPLNPRQRELVEGDIENYELALHGRPMRYTGGDARASGYSPEGDPGGEKGFMGRPPVALPDPEMVREALAADRATLKAGTPPEYSGHRLNLLKKIYDEEIVKYRDGLLSEGQLWENSQALLTQHMRHEEANQQRAKLISNIHAILDPQDDMFNINVLRPTQAIKFNAASFRRGYEGVKWTPEDEVERQIDELDDETYRTFLMLKTAVSEAGVIMAKMTVDRATYDACEARLAEQHRKMDLLAPVESPPERPLLEELVRAVGEAPGMNFRDVTKTLKTSTPEVKRIITLAVEEGHIERTPEGGYRLTPTEEAPAT